MWVCNKTKPHMPVKKALELERIYTKYKLHGGYKLDLNGFFTSFYRYIIEKWTDSYSS